MRKEIREYLGTLDGEAKRNDCMTLVNIMEEESGYKASLRGKIVGFGIHHYVHDNGRQGDAVVTGFMPRTQDIAIYIMSGLSKYQKDLENLGKYKSGKVCLYVRKLEDIDQRALRRIIKQSVRTIQNEFECWDA